MDEFIHQVFSGLATGGVYASLALALVMIYQATHHINFAQGEMAMTSTYLCWALIDMGMPYWVAFFLTLIISFAMGVGIQRFVIQPVEKAPVLSVVIVFIGVLVILNSVVGWIFGYTMKSFPSPFPEKPIFSNGLLNSHELGTIGVTFLVVGGLFAFLRFTPLGLAMRAAATNPTSSHLVGIRVNHMLWLGWGVAAAIGGIAGMMIAPITFLDPNMMVGVLLYASAAALLGGIDNPIGAVLGGFILGVLENVIGAFVIGTELKLTVALGIMVITLLIKPSGLLGKTVVTRV
jgi:branched-chain amino acid transport system permease protein